MDRVTMSSFLRVQLVAAFFEEGYTPEEMGFPGMTTQEVIALMEEPERSITTVPEPSTWLMLLIGFAGLGLAGYRSTRRAPCGLLSSEHGFPYGLRPLRRHGNACVLRAGKT
jgi:hypothetical protein